jgi:predicted nuclease of restriction endonuclease-like RecB superfamily
VPEAWGGGFPIQVRFKIPKKNNPITRDTFKKIVHGSRFPEARLTDEQVMNLNALLNEQHKKPVSQEHTDKHTLDGHKVHSEGEVKIDDWLYLHRIAHAYEWPILNSAYRCDFYIPKDDTSGVYVEYWGKNDSQYLANKKKKQKFYTENKLTLINIEVKDLKNIDSILLKYL